MVDKISKDVVGIQLFTYFILVIPYNDADLGSRNGLLHDSLNTVGELRSTLCTKTPLYVRSDSYIGQMPLEHLSYIKQMPLEHLSYIKETSWNTSDRT